MIETENHIVIGIDLGATNMRGALVGRNTISNITSKRVNSTGTEQEVLEGVFKLIDGLIDDKVKAIGIGVPSVVDLELGIVYDVQFRSRRVAHLLRRQERRVGA